MSNFNNHFDPNDRRYFSRLIGEVQIAGLAYPLVEMCEADDDGLINAFLYPDPSQAAIVMSRAALALPAHLRLAIIGHELGHDAHEHWREPRCLRNEVEADAFAVHVAGYEATHQLLVILRRSHERRGICAAEVIERLKRLEGSVEAPKSCPKRIPSRRRKRKGRK